MCLVQNVKDCFREHGELTKLVEDQIAEIERLQTQLAQAMNGRNEIRKAAYWQGDSDARALLKPILKQAEKVYWLRLTILDESTIPIYGEIVAMGTMIFDYEREHSK